MRGFDIASRVAESRAGDCTEHAVLLTALLRAHGVPARVVLGAAVVLSAKQLSAWGHAWTEYFDVKRWQRLDAALFQERQVPIDSAFTHEVAGSGHNARRADAPLASTPIRRLYLPRVVVRREGPGYMRDLLPVLKSFSHVSIAETVPARQRARL